MDKIKKIFELLKVWWKDPKKRGLMQLAFWFLFFTLVVKIYRSSTGYKNMNVKANKNNSQEKIEEKKNVSEEINSYEYEYQIQSLNKDIGIKGTHCKDKDVFYINNNKYYIVNNEYYDTKINQKTKLDYPLNEWKYDSLKNIITNITPSNSTVYKSGIVKYEYNVNSIEYNKYYNTNYENDIIIEAVLNKKIIEEASINYSNYKVNIKFNNINEIDDLEINLEKR